MIDFSEVELRKKLGNEEENPLNTETIDNIKTPAPIIELKNDYNKGQEGLDKLVSSTDKGKIKNIYIDYPAIFGRSDMEKYKELFKYDISLRTYQNISDIVTEDVNYILNEYPKIALQTLNIRTKWYRTKDVRGYTDVMFFEDIRKIITDEGLRSVIKSITESTYEISLDKANENNKQNVQRELQVTDKVNKAFISSALMTRFVIPLICQHFIDTDRYFTRDTLDTKERINGGFIKIFTYILSVFSKEYDVDAVNKLYKIVEPRVIKTNNAHRVMWRFLGNRSIDNHSVIDETSIKIIRQIIPKMKVNTSSISFFDSVIRKSVDYYFRYNYSFTYRPFKLNTNSEEDDIDEMERISMKHHHKENELDRMIHRLTMKNYIDKKIKQHEITDKEIKAQYNRFSSINDFQKNILNIYFSRYFRIFEYDRTEIVTLLIILSRELKKNNINIISDLVVARVVSGEKGRNSGKTSYDILSDSNYQKALDMFTLISDLLIRDNFILKLSSVHSYNFSVLDDDFNEVVIDEIDKKSLSSEISEFISLQ